MKTVSKVILISAALLTASGVAIAGRGFNCDGQGPYGHGPARFEQMQGQFGPGKGMHRGGRGQGVIYQLDNLSDEQKQQISALRKQHQDQRFAMREQMALSRAEMKKQIDAVLTDEQRQQLSELAPWH